MNMRCKKKYHSNGMRFLDGGGSDGGGEDFEVRRGVEGINLFPLENQGGGYPPPE